MGSSVKGVNAEKPIDSAARGISNAAAEAIMVIPDFFTAQPIAEIAIAAVQAPKNLAAQSSR